MWVLHARADLFGGRDVQRVSGGSTQRGHTGCVGVEDRLDRKELKERMSGNLCRCGAYVGICEAIRDAFAIEVKR